MKNFFQCYWLYVLLIIVFLAVRVSPFSCGSAYLDPIINEAAIGAFGSVIVAFIITFHEDQVRIAENRLLNTRVLLPLFQLLIEYMESLCISCAQEDNKLSSQNKTFEEWAGEYRNYFNKISDNKGIVGDEIEYYKGLMDRITAEIQKIEDNKVFLLEKKVLQQSDLRDLNQLRKTLCWKATINGGSIPFFNDKIVQSLKQIELFKGLLNVKYCRYNLALSAKTEIVKDILYGE